MAVTTVDFPCEEMVTDPGNVTDGDPEARLNVAPAGPAAPLSEIVPSDFVPPVTVTGLNWNLSGLARLMVRALDTPVPVAVMVATVSALTPGGVNVNVWLVAPSGTRTDDGI